MFVPPKQIVLPQLPVVNYFFIFWPKEAFRLTTHSQTGQKWTQLGLFRWGQWL
jgi:hypothetical protein